MKTLELYIEILKKLRYETLTTSSDLSVTRLVYGTPAYEASIKITEACLCLSTLLETMQAELNVLKSKKHE